MIAALVFAATLGTFGEKEGTADLLAEASVGEQQELEGVVNMMVDKFKGIDGIDKGKAAQKSVRSVLEFMKKNNLLDWPGIVSFAGWKNVNTSKVKEQTFGREPCTPPFCRYRCAREPAKLTTKQLAWPERLYCPEGAFHPISFGIPGSYS